MDISDEQVGDGIWRIALGGRMDIEGVGRIETRLAGMCAAPRKALIVDMSGVRFMSSIGIRALLINAKAVAGRGGRLVLLRPEPSVRGILASSGIDTLIPVFDTMDDALAGVAA